MKEKISYSYYFLKNIYNRKPCKRTAYTEHINVTLGITIITNIIQFIDFITLDIMLIQK